MNINRTVAEALAIAVLRGDDSAAYALVDQLVLERETSTQGRGYQMDFGRAGIPSQQVYAWPEFRALCERLGVRLGLPTTTLTITLPLHGLAHVIHQYRAHTRIGAEDERE